MASAARPATVIDVPAGDAAAEQVVAALDAALAAAPAAIAVRLLLAGEHPGRAGLAELCAADPRLELAAPGAEPGPCELHVVVPPAVRLGGRSLEAIAELLADGSAAAVEVAVPRRPGRLGRSFIAARLPGTPRVRAERPGASGPTVRPGAHELWLGSARAPVTEPPPLTSLAHERAEHLRHRARSATLRARLDRNAQRLTRERMRYQHERARASLLDRRLAEVSTRHRLGRLGRRVTRPVLAAPQRLGSLAGTGRRFVRRAWRFVRDRRRQRRSPVPRGPHD